MWVYTPEVIRKCLGRYQCDQPWNGHQQSGTNVQYVLFTCSPVRPGKASLPTCFLLIAEASFWLHAYKFGLLYWLSLCWSNAGLPSRQHCSQDLSHHLFYLLSFCFCIFWCSTLPPWLTLSCFRFLPKKQPAQFLSPSRVPALLYVFDSSVFLITLLMYLWPCIKFLLWLPGHCWPCMTGLTRGSSVVPFAICLRNPTILHCTICKDH